MCLCDLHKAIAVPSIKFLELFLNKWHLCLCASWKWQSNIYYTYIYQQIYCTHAPMIEWLGPVRDFGDAGERHHHWLWLGELAWVHILVFWRGCIAFELYWPGHWLWLLQVIKITMAYACAPMAFVRIAIYNWACGVKSWNSKEFNFIQLARSLLF